MDAFYLSAKRDDNTSLCIAPLTKRRIEAAGESLSDCGGYYLFERCSDDPDSVHILARIPSEEAAFQLAGLLHLE